MIKRFFSGLMAVAMVVSGFNTQAVMYKGTERKVSAATLDNGVVDPVEPTDNEQWNLVWHDEFNDGELNSKIWEEEGDVNSKYNKELQYYTSNGNNIEFGTVDGEDDNGKLIIVAKKEETENADLEVNDETGEVVTGTKYYTSTRLNTINKIWFNPGNSSFTKPDDVEVVNCTKIEARMKMPTFMGSWPAFWMMGTIGEHPTNGEIDVVEVINGSNIAYGTAHWANKDGEVSSSGSNMRVDVSQWHTYTVVWTDTTVEWFVDDVLFHRVNAANREEMVSLFGPQYLLLNLAVGGRMTGILDSEGIDQEAFETEGASQLEVDYVRAYAAVPQEEEEKDKVIVLHDFVKLAPQGLQGSVAAYDGATGEITTTKDGFVANITNNGINPWDAQIMMTDLPYVNGETYTLTGTLVSDVPVWVPIVINYNGGWYGESGIWLNPGEPKELDYSFTVPGDFTEQLDIYIQFGGLPDLNNSPINITGTNLSMQAVTEMEVEELIEKHYTGFTSSGYGSDTVANITTDKHGFVADITSAGTDIWASQARISDVDYYPGTYHTFVTTITSDVDRTVLVKIEGTGTETLSEEVIQLKAGETITYTKNVYVDSDYAYRDDDNVDIIFALGGGTDDPSDSSTITVTDTSFYPTDATNMHNLKYYTEVGQKIDISIPEIASRKSIIAPLTAKVWEERNVKLDYTNITPDSNNTGNLETNYDNLQEIDFTSAQAGVDAYSIKFNYVNIDNVPEFRATETVDLVINNYDAPDKIYVLDYGLPVELMGGKNDLYSIDPTANISNRYNTQYQQISVMKLGAMKNLSAALKDTTTYAHEDFQCPNEFNGSQGTVKNTISTLDNVNVESVKYTPNSFMTDIDEFYYAMQVFEMGYPLEGVATDYTNATPVMTGTVQVMPANVVYYEDNFITVNKGGATTEVGSKPNDKYMQSNDKEGPYGYDDTYTNDQSDSGGKSTVITTTAYYDENGTYHAGVSDEVNFTFKGTGFDIVGRTGKNSPILLLQYTNNGKTVTKFLNTYYANGELLQLPVFSIRNLNYEEHTVKLLVSPSKTAGTDINGNNFIMDGIRIYNPSQDPEVVNNYTVEEQWASFLNVQDMLLGTGEIEQKVVVSGDKEIVVDTEAEGRTALLVNVTKDETTINKPTVLGYSTTEEITNSDKGLYSNSLVDYLAKGPNCEVYLSNNDAIALKLSECNENTALQVEAKAVGINTDGTSAAPKLRAIYKSGNSYVEQQIAEVATNTAMYYKIPLEYCTKVGSDYIVIIAAESSSDRCISLSNIKASNCTISQPEAGDDQVIGLGQGTDIDASFEFTNLTVEGAIAEKQAMVKITVRADEDFNGEFDAYFDTASPDGQETAITYEYSNNPKSRWHIEGNVDNGDGTKTYIYSLKMPNSMHNMNLVVYHSEDGSTYRMATMVRVKLMEEVIND